MKTSRWLPLLTLVGLAGCGDDTQDGISYLPIREAQKQNAPYTNGDCPEEWKSSHLISSWTLRTGLPDSKVIASDIDVCGNIYIGWNEAREGHLKKLFPDGRLAWERTLPDGPRTDLFSISTTSAGGVLASTWMGTTVLQANGETDPILATEYFTSLRFSTTLTVGSGWLAVNSGGVIKLAPSSSEPTNVLLGGVSPEVIENFGFVQLLALDDRSFRSLYLSPPKIPFDSYVRQEGDELPKSDEPSLWKALIFSIRGENGELEKSIAIEDEVTAIIMGNSPLDDLLLVYVTREVGVAVSKLWNGSGWTVVGDAGFYAKQVHALPNGESLIVGLQEKGPQMDVGSVAGFTVSSGELRSVDWHEPPTFLTQESRLSSVILASGDLLVIGSDPIEKDLRGEILPLKL